MRDTAGWVPLIEAANAIGATIEELAEWVSELAPHGYYPTHQEGQYRQRFQLDLEAQRIRAVQGHGFTIDIETLGEPYGLGTTNFPEATRLWHATLGKHKTGIVSRGLAAGGLTGDRAHVHLVPVFQPFEAWTRKALKDHFGTTSDSIIVEVDVQRAIAAGIRFYRNVGGIVLTRGVPLDAGGYGIPPQCLTVCWNAATLQQTFSLLDFRAPRDQPDVQPEAEGRCPDLPPGCYPGLAVMPKGRSLDGRLLRLYPLTWRHTWPQNAWMTELALHMKSMDRRLHDEVTVKGGTKCVSTDNYVYAWLAARRCDRGGPTLADAVEVTRVPQGRWFVKPETKVSSHAEYRLVLKNPTVSKDTAPDTKYTWHGTSIFALASILTEGGLRPSEAEGAREQNACWTSSSSDDPSRCGYYAMWCPFGPCDMFVQVRIRVCCQSTISHHRSRTSLVPVHLARVAEAYLTVSHVSNIAPGDGFVPLCSPDWEAPANPRIDAAPRVFPEQDPLFSSLFKAGEERYPVDADMPFWILREEPVVVPMVVEPPEGAIAPSLFGDDSPATQAPADVLAKFPYFPKRWTLKLVDWAKVWPNDLETGQEMDISHAAYMTLLQGRPLPYGILPQFLPKGYWHPEHAPKASVKERRRIWHEFAAIRRDQTSPRWQV